jgi:signal transduction histidine kinase
MTESPLADLLTALDMVVMQRVGPGAFYLHGTPTGWMRRVNARWKGERELLASRTFPFLDHFLVDAEAFWSTGEPGRISSGLSSEPGADGTDVHFEAWAVTVEPGAQYLALELRRDGAAFQAMLQRAREGLLEHERLLRAQEALTRSQAELRRATAAAETTAASQAAMLRTITQEVRTPVHAIIGLAGLMVDSVPPAQARFLSLIRSSSETLLTVLNDMLDASRLEAGALPLEERSFEVRDTIEEALGVVAVRAAARGLDLTCQVELAVPETVIGDRSRWRLVLVNLLDNAVSHASAGEIQVFAEATDQGDRLTEIHVAVRDEGPALAPADLDRLVVPIAAEATGDEPRRGMGLMVCRALLERMGGRLWADANDTSTTFHFTTPFAVAAGPSSSYLRPDQPVLERKRAWIVAGSGAIERLLVRELRFWGMAPRATTRIADTTEWLSTDGPPDVVIVDRTSLPEDGVPDWPAPVIELVSLDRAHEAAGRHVAALLTKPLRTSRLHAHLVTLLGAPAVT